MWEFRYYEIDPRANGRRQYSRLDRADYPTESAVRKYLSSSPAAQDQFRGLTGGPASNWSGAARYEKGGGNARPAIFDELVIQNQKSKSILATMGGGHHSRRLKVLAARIG